MRNLLLIPTILFSFIASGQIVTTHSEKHEPGRDIYETTFTPNDKIGKEGNKSNLCIVNTKEISIHEDEILPEDTVFTNLFFISFSSRERCSVSEGDKIYFKQANGNVIYLESQKTFFCRYSSGSPIHSNNVCYNIDEVFMKKIMESDVVEITIECSVSVYKHTINISPGDEVIIKQLFKSAN